MTILSQATWNVPQELQWSVLDEAIFSIAGPALAVLIPLALGFFIVYLIVRTVKRRSAAIADARRNRWAWGNGTWSDLGGATRRRLRKTERLGY